MGATVPIAIGRTSDPSAPLKAAECSEPAELFYAFEISFITLVLLFHAFTSRSLLNAYSLLSKVSE